MHESTHEDRPANDDRTQTGDPIVHNAETVPLDPENTVSAPFVAFTQPSQVLDPKRVLVASTSNFGAPLAQPGAPECTILSIDPNAAAIIVPPNFAMAGGQASALGGAVQVYSAQNASFLNSVAEPGAATASLPAPHWCDR